MAIQAIHLDRFSGLQDSYDRIAEEYCRRIFDELAHKPLDRQLLQRLANTVKSGPICDVGCGPGHVARFLKSCEADVFGIDLSPRMIELARRLTPEIQFFQGNMLSLEVADGSCGAIAAFYSIIHLTPEELPKAFLEFKRVLRPGGTLLLAFHVGKEAVHEDELWGYQVSLDLRFLESREIEEQLHATGFRVRETIERETYGEDVEYPSRRAYIFAEKPQLRG